MDLLHARRVSPSELRSCRFNPLAIRISSVRKSAAGGGFSSFVTHACEYKTDKKAKSAFTLAEVLITLVIIGVVAALTTPVLMANYRKQEISIRLTKFYSNLSNAVKLAEVEYRTPSTRWDYSKGAYAIWGKYLQKYMPLDEITASSCIGGKMHDGTIITQGWDYGSTGIGIEIDVNGAKGPNALGRDRFEFDLLSGTYIKEHPVAKAIDTYYYMYNSYGTNVTSISREDRLKFCQNSGYYCSGLIMYDGWEIKSDYPYKI
ncbi:MAG: type II secretion system GspH family protein [Candidatus Gastranaerophilales bacterium]|nr:type II secretion system GspH family protein [Candidatus Gastranaerophilales bacterium]